MCLRLLEEIPNILANPVGSLLNENEIEILNILGECFVNKPEIASLIGELGLESIFNPPDIEYLQNQLLVGLFNLTTIQLFEDVLNQTDINLFARCIVEESDLGNYIEPTDILNEANFENLLYLLGTNTTQLQIVNCIFQQPEIGTFLYETSVSSYFNQTFLYIILDTTNLGNLFNVNNINNFFMTNSFGSLFNQLMDDPNVFETTFQDEFINQTYTTNLLSEIDIISILNQIGECLTEGIGTESLISLLSQSITVVEGESLCSGLDGCPEGFIRVLNQIGLRNNNQLNSIGVDYILNDIGLGTFLKHKGLDNSLKKQNIIGLFRQTAPTILNIPPAIEILLNRTGLAILPQLVQQLNTCRTKPPSYVRLRTFHYSLYYFFGLNQFLISLTPSCFLEIRGNYNS